MSLPLLSQDLPEPNKEDLLKQLDQATSQTRNTNQKRRAAALSQINSQASSGSASVDFYLRALDGTKYKTNHPAFIDWNRQNDRLLHTIAFQNAVLLQFLYLNIALQRDDQHDAYSQIPQVLAYLNTLAGKQTTSASSQKLSPEATTLLQQPLSGAEVVQWLQIEDLLPDGKSFAPAPGIYEEIMEKNVRVPLREKKDNRLPATWDSQIAVEAAIAKVGNTPDQTVAFSKSRLPELLFKKAQDTALIGQPNRAISEVLLLIQHYPNNPSVKDWIDYARAGLTNTAPASEEITKETNSDISVPTSTPSQESASSGTSSTESASTSASQSTNDSAATNTAPAKYSPFGTLTPP